MNPTYWTEEREARFQEWLARRELADEPARRKLWFRRFLRPSPPII